MMERQSSRFERDGCSDTAEPWKRHSQPNAPSSSQLFSLVRPSFCFIEENNNLSYCKTREPSSCMVTGQQQLEGLAPFPKTISAQYTNR